MTKYIFHTLNYKERFDTLARKYYGNSFKIAPIIEKNPHIPISGEIQEGSVICIPIEEKPAQDTSLLPVWKR